MLLKKIIRNIAHIPGWHTNRKIVVIESDDWGSIRMASKNAYQALLKSGLPVDKDFYNKYDSLESEDDLTALFGTLKQFKDQSGNYPVITANTIVANPDFERIKESNFTNYYYEHFTRTLNRYSIHSSTFDVWRSGINEGFFQPQFHGREHVNVAMWMKALQDSDKEMLLAFDQQVFGISSNNENNKRANYMAGFDYRTTAQLESVKQIVKEGLQLFEDIFEFKSQSFIAPCYVWSGDLEGVTSEQGVRAIQGIPYQYMPCIGKESYQRKMHFTGNKNQYGQTYLVRNAFFEPTLDENHFSMYATIKRIESAFIWRKPAIIGSHRINYTGTLVEANRTNNLVQLRKLLATILKKWPDVEFMSSDQLSAIIESK
jgi:hypothetical protein